MIGSRKGSGYSSPAGYSAPKKAAAKARKKALAIAREYQKILIKKEANELRILKDRQRNIVDNQARAALREAMIASAEEHKRLRSEVEFKKAGIAKQASTKRSASRKEIAVVRKQDGRLTKLRTGLVVEQKGMPAADSVKTLIEYKFVPSGKHLSIESHWEGRHPQQAIDRAKASLERYAKSRYDEIRIYSKKYMGRVYFHVSGTQQMIDWQPAKAPPRNSHGGEVRARGVDTLARRGVSFKK